MHWFLVADHRNICALFMNRKICQKLSTQISLNVQNGNVICHWLRHPHVFNIWFCIEKEIDNQKHNKQNKVFLFIFCSILSSWGWFKYSVPPCMPNLLIHACGSTGHCAWNFTSKFVDRKSLPYSTQMVMFIWGHWIPGLLPIYHN